MDPSEDSDNDPKMKIAVVIGSIIIITELIYFTQFSGIKIPIKFPEISMIPLIIFMRSLKKPTPTPTSPPLPTKIPTPTLTPINENLNTVEYEGTITAINPIDIVANLPPSNDKYLFSFNLEVGSSEWAIKTITIYFNKNELNVMKVFDQTGNIISYKDLFVGQKIRFIKTYELNNVFKPNIKITILK